MKLPFASSNSSLKGELDGREGNVKDQSEMRHSKR